LVNMPKRSRLRRKSVHAPKGSDRLERQMAIIVPSTKEFNKPVSNHEFMTRVDDVKQFLHHTFGGTTRVLGTGTYLSKKTGKVADERVVVVQAFADAPDWVKKGKSVYEFLQDKAAEWGQENVGYQFENDLILIYPESDSRKS
jgi:hypothetical protein